MGNPKVFISYRHDSPAPGERGLSLARALRGRGSEVEIGDWPRWRSAHPSAVGGKFRPSEDRPLPFG